jgi:hypothetical protein
LWYHCLTDSSPDVRADRVVKPLQVSPTIPSLRGRFYCSLQFISLSYKNLRHSGNHKSPQSYCASQFAYHVGETSGLLLVLFCNVEHNYLLCDNTPVPMTHVPMTRVIFPIRNSFTFVGAVFDRPLCRIIYIMRGRGCSSLQIIEGKDTRAVETYKR